MRQREPTAPLRIGELARLAGVSVQAVRFYEREGLLAEPARRPSGYREYPESAVRRLRFLRRAKDLGFSLREIGELFALRVDRGTSCAAVRDRVLGKVAQVEGRIAELERIRAALVALAESCAGRGPRSECPILDALDGGAQEAAAASPGKLPEGDAERRKSARGAARGPAEGRARRAVR